MDARIQISVAHSLSTTAGTSEEEYKGHCEWRYVYFLEKQILIVVLEQLWSVLIG